MAATASAQDQAHTRLPNVLADIVCPLLSSSEASCLLYIVRRTYGFTAGPNAGAGERKQRDTIALSQFENGIVSGDCLLDLGTQLSRKTIKDALASLEAKELVDVRHSCLKCLWEPTPGAPSETAEIGSSGAPHCPRCNATLSRSWALAELTPRKVVELLNELDKKGRDWRWDKKKRGFRFTDPAAMAAGASNGSSRGNGGSSSSGNGKSSAAELERRREHLREEVWQPELVEQMITMAGALLKSGEVSLKRQVHNFYEPVVDLQQRYPSPPLIRYALEQTIAGPPLRQPQNQRWYRYTETVAKNNQTRFRGSKREKPGSVKTEAEQLHELDIATRERLREAGELNGSGETAAARAILDELLTGVEQLRALFDGDAELCANSLREAFKQGRSDFVGVRPNPYGLDFYPEWSWPE